MASARFTTKKRLLVVPVLLLALILAAVLAVPIAGLAATEEPDCKVELVFIVDTSGSMDNELSYLQNTLDNIVSDLELEGYGVNTYKVEIGYDHPNLAEDEVWNSWTTSGHTASGQPLPYSQDGHSYRESWGPAVEYYSENWPINPHDPCAIKIIIPISDEAPYAGCIVDDDPDEDYYKWSGSSWIQIENDYQHRAPDRDSESILNAKTAAFSNDVQVVPMVGEGERCTGVTTLMNEISLYTTGTAQYYITTNDTGFVNAIKDIVRTYCIPLQADITPDPAKVCAGINLQLYGNASGGSGSYTGHSWTGPGAIYLSSTTVQNPIFNAPSSGAYSLTSQGEKNLL